MPEFNYRRWRLAAMAIVISSVTFAWRGVTADLTQYVDPFIGTAPAGSHFGFSGNAGDVFPGAAWPRGMLQWSPDTPSDLPGGYFYPDNAIKGFSIRHFSGRGCICYQDFAFMPCPGQISTPPSRENEFHGSAFSHANEKATPGYYRVRLDNGVEVELTTTVRTGMGRFTFPPTNVATLLINAASSVTGATTNTSLTLIGNNEVQGWATARVGCGRQLYTIYFVARFDRPWSRFGTWNGDTIKENSEASRSSTGNRVGAILTFDARTNRTIVAKVGISFVSIHNAELNLNAENPGWNFAAVHAAAAAAWNKVLNKVVVHGGTLPEKRTFYTALYHCFFHPNVFNDVNGEYRGMDGNVHKLAAGRSQYENIPCWDHYRSATALTALLAPDQASDIMQSLVNYARQGGGGLPRWEQVNRNSGGMVGDGPVIMLATAYALGATNFDTAAALAAMNLNAGTPGTTSDGNLVRARLADYLKLGYVPRAAAITLEYASADFALSQFAKALGNENDYRLYLGHSAKWRNLYNDTTGYIQPRKRDGSWVANVTPTTKRGYVEGNAAQYTWLVPFDLKELFGRMGGDARAVSRLDEYFVELNAGPASPHAFMGNEPCEGDPWEYDYAGAPAKTQAVVRRIQTQLFHDSPNGLPGNDDAGALSSWYVFSALGFYPLVPGVGGFVLGSPLFPGATIHLENGRQIVIRGAHASAKNCYVQSLKINGARTTRLWLPFAAIRDGATLTFELGEQPSTWGTGASNAPPSFTGDANND